MYYLPKLYKANAVFLREERLVDLLANAGNILHRISGGD